MPLRDHFRPPLDDVMSWDGVHGQWPAMMVLSLSRRLPRRYVAVPHVHLGTSVEIDTATFERDEPGPEPIAATREDDGGMATAVWAPPMPTMAVTVDLPEMDEYEVRVFDARRGRRLVAAVELVSPSNKDRPDSRRGFAGKCAAYLQRGLGVVVADIVTERHANLHRELMEIWRKLGQTIVMVTHDLDEAILLSDRVVVLSGPPSRVLLDERIRIPHPRDVFTLRETPQFVSHVQSLWSVLGQQFRAAA